MSIKNYADLMALRDVGYIVHVALSAMAMRVRVGITTGELADIGGRVMRQNGARSAPALVYGFPGDVLISLNDEAVHGIPNYSRKVQANALPEKPDK
jgi:methionyl aminopeptidase